MEYNIFGCDRRVQDTRDRVARVGEEKRLRGRVVESIRLVIDRFVSSPPDSFVAGHGGKKTSTGRLESRGADDGDEEEKEVSGHDGRDGQD